MKQQGIWLKGWSDLVANLKVTLNCMKLIDVGGNNSNNLVVADQSGRLVCYKNTHIEWETRVQDIPISLCSFYLEQQGGQQQPHIAVAAGGSVLIYRIFKAFFQVKLQSLAMGQKEEDIWKQYIQNQNLQLLIQALQGLDKNTLSYKSIDMITYLDEAKLLELAQRYSSQLYTEDAVTCMDVLRKTDEESSIGSLVVGTENRFLYILNQDVTAVDKKFVLAGTPIQICVFPDESKSPRIAVLLRENMLQYFNKDGEVEKIGLASKPITMVRQSFSIYVATMDRTVSRFVFKQKDLQIQVKNHILAIEQLQTGFQKEIKGFLVAQNNQTIQFFIDQQLISTIALEANVSVMKYGCIGKEDGFLVIITQKGGIDTRILQRTRKFSQQTSLPDDNSYRPIELKITQLLIEGYQREKEQGKEMIRQYQYDIQRMRLRAAQTYLGLLKDENLAPQLRENIAVRLAAQVEGLGPRFKLVCAVENLSKEVIPELILALKYNAAIFKIEKTVPKLEYIIPKVSKRFIVEIRNIHPQGLNGVVIVELFKENQKILSSQIQMPLSEIE